MPVKSAFKLHLITLNGDRLARVIASFEQKLVFLESGLKGPLMGQLCFRTLTPQNLCSLPVPPTPRCSLELLVQAF